jgi:hypothetical protein
MLRSPSSRRNLESSAAFVGMAVSFGSLDACSSRDSGPSASGTGASPATAAGDIPAPAMSDLGEPAESSNDMGQDTASAVPWQVSDALPSSCVGNAKFTNAQGPFVRTFGKLAGTQPEIVRMATPELVPVRWSRPRLEGISDDGRLMFGKAVNPDGQQQGWLLHSSQRCTEL